MHEGQDFVREFRAVQAAVHLNAIAHGWWEGERNDGETIALIHSELSEALEALRLHNPPSSHIGGKGFCSLSEELADVVIRCMDFAESKHLDLAAAIKEKYVFNTTRPYKHGNKKF